MPLTHTYREEDVARFYAVGYWTKGSMWEHVAATAAAAPDRPAVIEGDVVVSWGRLAELAECVAGALAARGVGHSDVVGVQLPNSLHLVVTIVALMRLGAVYHPLNPSYRLHDLGPIVAVSKPVAYLYPRHFRDFDYGQLVQKLRANSGQNFAAIEIDLSAPVDVLRSDTAELPPVAALSADDVFLIGATSGSTGAPKLYLHTQNTQKNEARILNRELGIGAHDRFLPIAPLTHRGALMFGLLTALDAAATLAVLREYKADEVLRQIDANGITALMAIPAQVSDLLDLIEKRPDSARTLRLIMITGAPVSPDLIRRLKSALPACTPLTGYGTSETGYSLFTRPGDSVARLQTCGRTMPGMEVRIAAGDNDGIQDGEIQLRGAFVSCGYYANPEATAASLTEDGWFRTGDIGHLDEDGYLIVSGRQRNVIIRAGLKIQAEEVEQVINQHPRVKQSVVVAVPDERLGESAVVFVVPGEGETLALPELLSFLENLGVAKFKWPERLVLMPELPVNAIGKIDRIVLRGRAASEAITPRASGKP